MYENHLFKKLITKHNQYGKDNLFNWYISNAHVKYNEPRNGKYPTEAKSSS